jgi:hypothetical protein
MQLNTLKKEWLILFVYGFINDMVSISEYMASNGKAIGE